MTQSTTPVLLLTGYLGSGKTTLLNRILSNQKGIRFAVIVNDIGEVNIDASLIAQGGIVGQNDDSLVPLQNGCICCTLKMDLVQQLSDLVSQRQFDYIVIEASGICEPAPIAQTIDAYPTLYPNLATNGVARLDSIVTVVDALRLRDEFAGGQDLYKKDMAEDDLASLVIQQVEFCNMILLNKASEVSPEELEHIKAILRELQPKAEIITCDYCDVPLEKLINCHGFDFETVATSARWVAEVEGSNEMEHEKEEHHHEEHHHDHCHCHDLENEAEGEALEYGIGTFVYQRRKPFSMVEFDQFVARLFPKSVIRCKGMCYFDTEPDMCYVFEQAGKQVSLSQAGQWYATMPADELEQFKKQNPQVERDWDEQYGDRMQKLVFIGQNMDREAIETLLDACLVKKHSAR
jgi:cobalamin synthesis protein/P47K family protein